MANKENKLEHLEELIRMASTHLLSKDERIGYLNNDHGLRDRLYGKYPKCFIAIYRKDATVINLPICNRLGIIDVDVINLSVKAIQKLMEDEDGSIDVNELTKVLTKLETVKNRYDKPVPKPPVPAAVKGQMTQMFNNIKNHLNTVIRNREKE